MSVQSFPKYRPLEGERKVRFLKLLPGDTDDEICFELVHDTLASLPPIVYDATSYTWGAPTPTRTVRCDGRLVEIRENAYDFLLRLRQPDIARFLWMDCICIDQSNLRERAEQVKIMHLIYRNARSVLIWLGLEGNHSALAMTFASRLDSNKYLEEFERGAFGSDVDKSFLFDEMLESSESQRLARATAALFCRSWVRRIWVQQEAAMCTDTRVLCGSKEIRWNEFFSLAWLARPRVLAGWPSWASSDLNDGMDLGIDAICNIQQSRTSLLRKQSPWANDIHVDPRSATYLEWESQSNELEQTVASEWQRLGPSVYLANSFHNLAFTTSGCEATDPRDKVYALYNMTTLLATSMEFAQRPKVDYSLPWQALYIRIAKWLYGCKHTRVLQMAGRSFQCETSIPSWVPNWRRKLADPLFPHSGWFSGGGSVEPHLRFLALPKYTHEGPRLPQYFYFDDSGEKKRITGEGLEPLAYFKTASYTAVLRWTLSPDISGTKSRKSRENCAATRNTLRSMSHSTSRERQALRPMQPRSL